MYTIEIVPRLVAVVEPDVHDVGIDPRNFVDERAHALGGGEIARGRNLLSSGGRGRRIDRVDVEILVAEGILDVEDVLPIPAPEVTGDGPLSVVGYELGIRVGVVDALHPDIARVLV